MGGGETSEIISLIFMFTNDDDELFLIGKSSHQKSSYWNESLVSVSHFFLFTTLAEVSDIDDDKFCWIDKSSDAKTAYEDGLLVVPIIYFPVIYGMHRRLKYIYCMYYEDYES